MESRRKKKDLEAALVMAEVKLACLLVDHRDDPEMQRLVTRQRDSVLTLRLRLAGNVSDGLVATLHRWPSPGVAVGRLRRALGAAEGLPLEGLMHTIFHRNSKQPHYERF